MPPPFSFGTIQAKADPIPAPQQETPFRICVLADFTGRQSRGAFGPSQEIAGRHLLRVTRDNLDEIMAKMGVRLQLPVGDGSAINLTFASLDDFHPDQIHDKVDAISAQDEAEGKSGWMNWVLHNPEFQTLEATWR